MATKLSASVGRRGKNNPDDVKAVQELLKPFASKVGFSAVKVDGKPTSALEKAIGKFQEEICQVKPDYRVDPGKTTIKKLMAGPSKAEAERKAKERAAAKQKDDQQKKMLADLKKTAEKEAKTQGLDTKAAQKVLEELESYATKQWDLFVAKAEKATDFIDLGALKKSAEDLLKEVTGKKSLLTDLVEDAKPPPEESGPDAKTPLILKAAETTIDGGCFTFTVSGKSPDKKAKVYLLPNYETNLKVDITKGFSKVAMVELFKKLDSANLWGKAVSFHAAETTDGKVDLKTVSKGVILSTPVAPFKGTVSLTGLAKDKGMKYTGNGKGRYLYTRPINGWYFLKYGPNFERNPSMRGFDCITYVGTANRTMKGMGGRGDGLANHLGATKVDMEEKSKQDVIEFFKGDGKSGTYIAWWSTHCIAVENGKVHEFSLSKGGYRTMAATSYSWPAATTVRKLKG